eukprot:1781397-Pyramimonas_sp.AAC.2
MARIDVLPTPSKSGRLPRVTPAGAPKSRIEGGEGGDSAHLGQGQGLELGGHLPVLFVQGLLLLLHALLIRRQLSHVLVPAGH